MSVSFDGVEVNECTTSGRGISSASRRLAAFLSHDHRGREPGLERVAVHSGAVVLGVVFRAEADPGIVLLDFMGSWGPWFYRPRDQVTSKRGSGKKGA